VSECKLSFDAVKVARREAALDHGLGAFYFSARGGFLMAVIPDCNGSPHLVSFNIGDPKVDPCWQWDGNKDKPTLSPSLHWVGNWHGFLRAGKFVSC